MEANPTTNCLNKGFTLTIVHESTPVLQAKDVGKTVQTSDGPLAILQDINFTIRSGESVAIVGASGSGKSTLLGLMAGLDLPTSGSIELMEHDLGRLDEDGRAKLRGQFVGFVFQSFQLVPHLNALENVMLPLEIRGTPLTEARELAGDCLARVGLSQRLMHYPKTLSGGEQQRVALARAFVSEPSILFADEPTGSLDEASGSKVIELLFELNRENGSTLILVTHDPQLAKRCSRQLTLQGGRLV
jgi:putative ABC transport system ATP-binding protein